MDCIWTDCDHLSNSFGEFQYSRHVAFLKGLLSLIKLTIIKKISYKSETLYEISSEDLINHKSLDTGWYLAIDYIFMSKKISSCNILNFFDSCRYFSIELIWFLQESLISLKDISARFTMSFNLAYLLNAQVQEPCHFF